MKVRLLSVFFIVQNSNHSQAVLVLLYEHIIFIKLPPFSPFVCKLAAAVLPSYDSQNFEATKGQRFTPGNCAYTVHK